MGKKQYLFSVEYFLMRLRFLPIGPLRIPKPTYIKYLYIIIIIYYTRGSVSAAVSEQWWKIWSLRMRSGKKALWERHRPPFFHHSQCRIASSVCVRAFIVFPDRDNIIYTFFSNRAATDDDGADTLKSTHAAQVIGRVRLLLFWYYFFSLFFSPLSCVVP